MTNKYQKNKAQQQLIYLKIKAKVKLSNTNLTKISKVIGLSIQRLSYKFNNGLMEDDTIKTIALNLGINQEFLFNHKNKNLLE